MPIRPIHNFYPAIPLEFVHWPAITAFSNQKPQLSHQHKLQNYLPELNGKTKNLSHMFKDVLPHPRYTSLKFISSTIPNVSSCYNPVFTPRKTLVLRKYKFRKLSSIPLRIIEIAFWFIRPFFHNWCHSYSTTYRSNYYTHPPVIPTPCKPNESHSLFFFSVTRLNITKCTVRMQRSRSTNWWL